MVERFCSGGVAIGGGNFGIGHEGLDQRLEMRILKSGDEVGEGLPELTDVFGGLGEVVGKFDFRVAQLAQLMDGELEALLVPIDEAFDFQEIKGLINRYKQRF